MTIENNYDEVEYLRSKGFKVKFLDDMSGWWLEKKVKSKFLNEPIISIEDFNNQATIFITVKGNEDLFVDLVEIKYNRKNLKSVNKLIKTK